MPSTLEFRGITVAKSGAWGQGPVLLQALAILDTFDRRSSRTRRPQLGIHTITEALKLALADRDAWYGDTDVPSRRPALPQSTPASGRR